MIEHFFESYGINDDPFEIHGHNAFGYLYALKNVKNGLYYGSYGTMVERISNEVRIFELKNEAEEKIGEIKSNLIKEYRGTKTTKVFDMLMEEVGEESDIKVVEFKFKINFTEKVIDEGW